MFGRYFEPFLGGGAMFLGADRPRSARLSDLNSDLIETYEQVRDSPDEVSSLLAEFDNNETEYYRIRAEVPGSPLERAARFIYLNHTSFNGIYRVNLKGEYNVPFGNRPRPNIPDIEHLRAASRRLAGTTLRAEDFEDCVRTAEEGDLVFLDPPYSVAHNNNGFVKYNQRLFSFTDQERLREVVLSLRDRGVYYVMTNAAHDSIRQLFELGDQRLELQRRSVVGGRSAARGMATEYLFTNMDLYAQDRPI